MRPLMSVHNSVGCAPILQYGTEEQKRRYLPDLASGRKIGCFCLTEPRAGSEAHNLRTRAEWYELSDTLVTAVRQRRMGPVKAEEALEAFGDMRIHTDASDLFYAIRRGRTLAAEKGLTAYDAAYLELAVRKGLGLATLDKGLSAAADSMGIKLFG